MPRLSKLMCQDPLTGECIRDLLTTKNADGATPFDIASSAFQKACAEKKAFNVDLLYVLDPKVWTLKLTL